MNIATWRCKGAEFSSCSSQGSPGLDCCCRVQLNGTLRLPLFSACKTSALGEFKPSLYLTQFESKEETFFCTDQLHLSWRNMIQSKLKRMNHILSITAVFEFFCLKCIFLRKLWVFFFPWSEKETEKWPVIFKCILGWTNLFMKITLPAHFISNSSTLLFVWHCFYLLVQYGVYCFQSNQTFYSLKLLMKTKIMTHSINGCDFVLDFTLHDKFFAVLQKHVYLPRAVLCFCFCFVFYIYGYACLYLYSKQFFIVSELTQYLEWCI